MLLYPFLFLNFYRMHRSVYIYMFLSVNLLLHFILLSLYIYFKVSRTKRPANQKDVVFTSLQVTTPGTQRAVRIQTSKNTHTHRLNILVLYFVDILFQRVFFRYVKRPSHFSFVFLHLSGHPEGKSQRVKLT